MTSSRHRWFDFGAEARFDLVDRRDDIPFARLQLATPVTEEVAHAARVAGWVSYDNLREFDHFAEVRSLKDFGDLLRPFFSEDSIRASMKDAPGSSPLALRSSDLSPVYTSPEADEPASAAQPVVSARPPSGAISSFRPSASLGEYQGERIARIARMADENGELSGRRCAAILAAIPLLKEIGSRHGSQLGWSQVSPHEIVHSGVDAATRIYADALASAGRENPAGEQGHSMASELYLAADDLNTLLSDELERTLSYLEFADTWLADTDKPDGLDRVRRDLEGLVPGVTPDADVVPVYVQAPELDMDHYERHLAHIYGVNASLVEAMGQRFDVEPSELDGMLWSQVRAADRYMQRDELIAALGADLSRGQSLDPVKDGQQLAMLRKRHEEDEAGAIAMAELDDAGGSEVIEQFSLVKQSPTAVPDMIAGLDVRRQADILAKVANAQRALGILRGPAAVPFAGGALPLWDKLRTLGDDVFAASAVARGLVMLRGGETNFRSYEENLRAVADGSQDRSVIEPLIGARLTEHCEHYAVAADQLEGILPTQRLWIGLLGGFAKELSVTVLDGAYALPEGIPADVLTFAGLDEGAKGAGVHLLDRQMPEAAVLDGRRRIAAALDFMTRGLGFSDVRELLNGDNVTVMLARRAAMRDDVHGRALSTDRASAIHLSPYQPFAAVHEIGHGIDFRRRESAKAMPTWVGELLEDSGVVASTRRILTEVLPVMDRDEISIAKRMAYYMAPAEIFARSVTAGLSAQIPTADKFARAAGGVFGMPLGMDYEPQAHVAATFLQEWASRARRENDQQLASSASEGRSLAPAF